MNRVSVLKYLEVRKRTAEISKPVDKDAYDLQPIYFVSPIKWHLGHTTWFFEELVLKTNSTSYQEYNPNFNHLFNSYYNFLGERTDRDKRGKETNASVAVVYAYRDYIDQQMVEFLENGDLSDEVNALITLGLNHEQQHQELMLTDLKYSLAQHANPPKYLSDQRLGIEKNSNSGWHSVDEGVYEIGFAGEEFTYDNELGRHKVYLNPVEINKALVTNGEYMEFIEAGGYRNFEHWHEEGWAWVNENAIANPMYWHEIDGSWSQFMMGGSTEVDPDAILAHVNFYEASAFAAWKGMRLPTEFEWEVAADHLEWGHRWEWTNSAYLPYPGFVKAKGAEGEYNGKFMVNQMVLRGGSVATGAGHSRKSYRNFFHPYHQWQYSGIRLAR